jgi:hypothetical protein
LYELRDPCRAVRPKKDICGPAEVLLKKLLTPRARPDVAREERELELEGTGRACCMRGGRQDNRLGFAVAPTHMVTGAQNLPRHKQANLTTCYYSQDRCLEEFWDLLLVPKSSATSTPILRRKMPLVRGGVLYGAPFMVSKNTCSGFLV